MAVPPIWIVAAPSEPLAVFQFRLNGAVVSVASDEPRTMNSTEAIGDVASEADAEIPTEPPTIWPSVGAPTSATSGLVLSTTLSGRSAVVTVSALSVIRMRRSYLPSGTAVVSQAAVYGAGPVVSVPIVVQVEPPAS